MGLLFATDDFSESLFLRTGEVSAYGTYLRRSFLIKAATLLFSIFCSFPHTFFETIEKRSANRKRGILLFPVRCRMTLHS